MTASLTTGAAASAIPAEHTALAARLDDLERHRSIDVEERLVQAQAVEAEAAAAGDVVAVMRARLVVADMLYKVGRCSEGTGLAVEVNDWAAAHGPQPLLARSHLVLSSIFESIGDVGSGLDHAVRAIELLGDAAPARDRGNYLLNLADALSLGGEADRGQARARYRQAERVFAELGDDQRRLVVLNNLAMLEYEAGHVAAAVEVAGELWPACGNVLDAAAADTVGRVLLVAGRLDEAEAVVREGHQLLAERGPVQAATPAELALTLAEILLGQGRPDDAEDQLDRCFLICLERGLHRVRVEALRVRAEILAARGLYEDAFHAHEAFHAEWVALRSSQQEAAARTRQALFETAEARRAAQRFWEQARTDPLTDVYNRRFVDEELPRHLAQAAARGQQLVAAIVDADHFKQVNDRFSHEIGDRVLVRVAALLTDVVRAGSGADGGPPGFAARLGGEEFLLVLVTDDVPGALAAVDGLRADVEGAPWAELAPGLRVTVSVGATLARPGDRQSSLLSRADRNLYRAKASGRNRTVADDRD